jgi:hypothetical protein
MLKCRSLHTCNSSSHYYTNFFCILQKCYMQNTRKRIFFPLHRMAAAVRTVLHFANSHLDFLWLYTSLTLIPVVLKLGLTLKSLERFKCRDFSLRDPDLIGLAWCFLSLWNPLGDFSMQPSILTSLLLMDYLDCFQAVLLEMVNFLVRISLCISSRVFLR